MLPILPDGCWLHLNLVAETTCLERALTPLKSDDHEIDWSLETGSLDENSLGEIQPKLPVEIPQPSTATEATGVPKKKQPAKQKSTGKTTIEGM